MSGSAGAGSGRARENALDMRSLAEVPLRRPLLVSMCFILCVALSVAAFFVVPKRYRSSTLILVEAEKAPSSFITQPTSDPTRKRLYTLNQEVLSRTRLERVLTELRPYDEGPGIPLSATVERMRDAIRIRVRGSDAFEIEYVHEDPGMAQKVAARLTSMFIEEVAAAREQQVEGASRFIEAQLAEARHELEAHEAAVGRFKERNMGSLPEQLATNLATLQRLQLEQQAVGVSLQAAQDRLAAMEAQLVTPGDRSSGEIRQMRIQLDELKGRYTDEHPDVRSLAARVASLEAGMATGVASTDAHRALADLRVEAHALKARRAEVDRRIAGIQASVDRAPRTEQDLATLTRDYKKLSENYLALLNKKLDTQMAEKLEKQWQGERFRILDPANRPERPFFPQLPVFLLAGVIAGAAAAVGLALLVDLLDHSIRSPADLESALGYGVLATVSHVGTPRGRTWPRARRVAS